MTTNSYTFLRIAGLQLLLLAAMAYPFLPGPYDRLALPISNLVQIFGIVALPLFLTGVLWLFVPGRASVLARISYVWSIVVALVLIFFALMSGGKLLALIVLTGTAALLIAGRRLLKKVQTDQAIRWGSIPYYLTLLPLLTFVLQLLLAKPLTQGSRDRAIIHAGELIAHIDSFYSRQGYYPPTLQAMYKDYYPNVVGIEKYHYLPQEDAYNISFEQGRFLLDVVGTREWEVYNPRDTHRVYSHSSWFLLLRPEDLARSQGWYASTATKHAHWKSFLFD